MTGSGPPILFITCPGITLEYWLPQVERLRDRFTCITYDLRGHGRSRYDHHAFHTAGLADDLVEILDHAGVQAPLLVGYSAGSSIALQTLLRHPSRAAGAVCVGSYHRINTTYLYVRATAAHWTALAGFSRLISNAVIGSNHVDKQHAAVMRKAARVDCRALAHLYQAALREDMTEVLPLITHPVQLVYGENDRHMLEHYGRPILRLLRNATMTVVPNADHRVPTRQPALFADLVTTFARQSLPSLPRPTNATTLVPEEPAPQPRVDLH